jgi:Domain of unknown function (DUF4232)
MRANGKLACVALVAAAAALLAGCRVQASGQESPSTVTVSAHDTPAQHAGEPAEPGGEPAEPASDDPAPCTAEDVEPRLAVGDLSPDQDQWDTELYVTNVSTATCRLDESGEITFFAAPGVPVDIEQAPFEHDGPADDLAVVAPGEQAEMLIEYGSAPADTASPHCPSPVSGQVVLPGDSQPLEFSPPEDADTMPPLCGDDFMASPWSLTAS